MKLYALMISIHEVHIRSQLLNARSHAVKSMWDTAVISEKSTQSARQKKHRVTANAEEHSLGFTKTFERYVLTRTLRRCDRTHYP